MEPGGLGFLQTVSLWTVAGYDLVMAESRIETVAPIDLAGSGADLSACHACGHDRPTEPYRNIDPIDGLLKLLGRPRAAMCGTPDETDPTGWTPAPCPCRNPFHGS